MGMANLPCGKEWKNGFFLKALKSGVESGDFVKASEKRYKLSPEFKKAEAKSAKVVTKAKSKKVSKTKPAAKKTSTKKKVASKKKTTTKKKVASKKKTVSKKTAPKKKTTPK